MQKKKLNLQEKRVVDKSACIKACSRGAAVPLLAAGLGQSHVAGLRKFDFHCLKGHWLAYYLFIFYVNLSAARGILVYI